ncbi:unnamed protein product [Notodromas monacha]|uniref:Peptidase S1 domain-containing protein n=1 Tax=Notodromas monacha TaxID=399045 RepID=A0A7R9BK74_9CRUS|nr:unnamed protein product [Notodromas monacha]CAG0915636.1 unnamed protein product [Notodromas monacha]
MRMKDIECSAWLLRKVLSFSLIALTFTLSRVAGENVTSPSPGTTRSGENFVDLANGVLCGMDTRQKKIVGGKNSVLGEYPFMVSLKMKHSLKHFCGGAIISENYILTAAHCVTNYLAPRLTVAVSELDLSGQSHDQSYEINPNRVIRHKYYDSRTYENDIALIRLRKPLTWSKSVQPICLSNNSEHYVPGRRAVVTGWGRTSETSRYTPSILQNVEVPVVTNDLCRVQLAEYLPIFSTQLCAGYPGGELDACQGDSGGPLVIKEGGRVYLVGIVSVGVGCARPLLPGVYTKISSYIDWITRNMS